MASSVNCQLIHFSTKSTCSQRTFRWSEQEFTLKELAANYRHLLPFPALVTHDCPQRKQPKVSPSSGQVYWVHDIVKCKYLIVNSQSGRQFKIPECMDAMVIPTKANGRDDEALPFHRIRSKVGYKCFRFADPQPDVITEDMKPVNDATSLRGLQVVDVCEEDMFVVHSVFMENLLAPSKRGSKEQSHYKVIPRCYKMLATYLPARVSIAVSLSQAPDIIYFHTLAEMRQVVSTYVHNYEAAMKDAAEILIDASRDPLYVNLSDVPVPCRRHKGSLTPAKVLDCAVPVARDIDPLRRLERVRLFCSTEDVGNFDAEPDKLENDRFLEPDQWLVLKRDYTDQPSVEKKTEKKSKTSWLRNRFQLRQRKHHSKGSRNEAKASNPRVGESHFAHSPGEYLKQRTSVPLLPSESAARSDIAQPSLSQRRSIDSAIGKSLHSQGRWPSGETPPINHPRLPEASVSHPGRQMPIRSASESHRRRILNIDDVPEDISQLSVNELMDCLVLLNLSPYIPMMQKKKVDGRLLMCMQEDELKTVFGLSDFNATKLVQFAKCGWRPKTGVKQPADGQQYFQRNINQTKMPGRTRTQ